MCEAGVLGPKVTGDHGQVWLALKGLTTGVARTVIMSVGGRGRIRSMASIAHAV